jgi:DNA-binding MarR family transcriptional regulator
MGGSISGKGKRRSGERFVKVPKPILDSKAWTELNYSAQLVYIYLRMDIYGDDRVELRFTYSQAKKRGINAATLCKAFKSLQEKGFITKVRHGGLMERESVYKLSWDWRKSGG